jgi:hypothetical protein
MTGLSIPIRENPGPGEYRYLSFAWIKWGGGQTVVNSKVPAQPMYVILSAGLD